MTRRFFSCAVLSVAVGSALQCAAAPLTVINTNDNLAGSLRQAIQDASAGDTIVFNIPTSDPNYNAATRSWTINVNSTLTISRDLQIDAAGQRIIINRNLGSSAPLFGVFAITAGTVRLTDLTISGGVDRPTAQGGVVGSGIKNSGTLILERCLLLNNGLPNDAGQGGAALGNIGTAAVMNCTFTGNHSDYFGTAIDNIGDLTVTGCTVAQNAGSGTSGGVIARAGTTRIRSSVIAKNTGTFCGPNTGCGEDVYGTFVSDGYNFIGNPDGSTGFANPGSHDQVGVVGQPPADPKLGALAYNSGATQTMLPQTGSTLIDQGNSFGLTTDQRGYPRPLDDPSIANPGDATDIGAVEIDVAQAGPSFTVTNTDERSDGVCGVVDCTLIEAIDASNASADANTVTFAAGVSGTITTNNLTPSGLSIGNPITIVGPGARVLALSGSNAGRCILNFSSATISGLSFNNGAISDRAAAIYSNGSLTLNDCMFNGNAVTNGAGSAIWAEPGAGSSIALNRCTFTNNTVATGSGALYLASGEQATVTNCTFAGNTAQSGAAIYNDGGTIALQHCTVSSNTANGPSGGTGGAGGALRNGNGGTFTLANTIVAANTAPMGVAADLEGAFSSLGYNLIGKVNGSTGLANSVNHDQVGSNSMPVNPQLDGAGVKDNGGLTNTVALLANSPAIDAGDPANTPATDQRDYPRVGAPDIGAFEYGSSLPTPTPTPTATPTPTPPSQLQNLSTRKQVGTDDNRLIGGFIVVGSDDKKVLVRGLGPSLPVNGALTDPTLELHDSTTALLAFNDNWHEASNASEIASILPPSDDLESAILTSLPAKPLSAGGAGYTGVLAGQGGTTGIGLLEIYDLNTAANSKLANISTRGFVGVGDDLLIGGFIPGPSDRTALKVLVRALGPSLSAQGVSGALEDPVLELHDANGVLVINDNWRDAANASEIQATLPPSDDRESAIITTLAPSNSGYTAVVRGANGATGVALVEVFALQ